MHVHVRIGYMREMLDSTVHIGSIEFHVIEGVCSFAALREKAVLQGAKTA